MVGSAAYFIFTSQCSNFSRQSKFHKPLHTHILILNIPFDMQLYTFMTNMRTLFILTIYAVYSVNANDKNNSTEDRYIGGTEEYKLVDLNFGPIHIHTKTGVLPQKHVPLRWDEKHATQKTHTLVNFVKSLPKLNPLNKTFLGPYNVSIPDVGFIADLSLQNLIVTGIKEIAVDIIEMRVAPSRIDLNVSIPRITIEADFLLNGVYESDYIFNHGRFNVTLLDLEVKAAIGPVTTRSNARSWYQLESADVTIDLKELQVRMNVIAFAEEIKSILNHFSQYTQDLVIDNNLLSILRNAINQELRKIPAKQITHYMLGTASISSLNGSNHKEKKISERYSK